MTDWANTHTEIITTEAHYASSFKTFQLNRDYSLMIIFNVFPIHWQRALSSKFSYEN